MLSQTHNCLWYLLISSHPSSKSAGSVLLNFSVRVGTDSLSVNSIQSIIVFNFLALQFQYQIEIYSILIFSENINLRSSHRTLTGYHSIPLCKIYWCSEILNTDDSPLFRYETFINFLTLIFRHEERERHNFYYADYTIPYPPAGLARPSPESDFNSRLFQNHQILSPSLPGMTSFTLQSYFRSGVFIMTFVIVISSERERELYSMCVHPH